jgi:DNA-directed RNA polymerase alpha subunit
MPQLLAQTRTDLLRRRMFGRKCLARLEQALAEHGLHLADNVSQPLHEQNWASGMLSELG